MLNYKAFSFFIAIALLIITSSNSVTGSDGFFQNNHPSELSDLAPVSTENHLMNENGLSLDSIQTSDFEPYWIEKIPLISPSARQHSAMAYDSFNDKTIIFGGSDGSNLGDTWAYDYLTNTWENMNPSLSPSPMNGHAMVYNTETHKIVLFGSGQTWTYDYYINTWEQQSPQVSPSSRLYHSMIYDTIRQKILMIGGTNAIFETWEMDSFSYNWTNLVPITPIPRLFAMAASFDQANDKIIVFGGQNSSSSINAGETYAFDYSSNEWNVLTPLVDPTDRRFYGRPMGYDILAQKSVFFGGTNNSLSFNQTWTFDYFTTTWEIIDTIGTPAPNWIHTMVFNNQANRFIMFGGFAGGFSDKTYELTAFSPIKIISPGDKVTELGGLSPSISWQLRGLFGGTYQIKLDNQIVNSGNFVDGQTVSLVPLGLGLGSYTVEMIASDNDGNSVSDIITLLIVEIQPPIIIGPEDLEMEIREFNKSIIWTLEDLTPANYNVTQNSTLIDQGNWQNGDNIVVNLDPLPLGHYIFEITVTDVYNNVASDIVLVNIIDAGIPIISSPSNMDLIHGDPQEIIWYISDNNPTFYLLEVNQQVLVNSSWVALPFVKEGLQSYIPGYYNFTLILYDASGNIISDTVLVQIYANNLNSNTQTSNPSGGGSGRFDTLPSIPPNVATGAGIVVGGTLFFAIIRRIRS